MNEWTRLDAQWPEALREEWRQLLSTRPSHRMWLPLTNDTCVMTAHNTCWDCACSYMLTGDLDAGVPWEVHLTGSPRQVLLNCSPNTLAGHVT